MKQTQSAGTRGFGRPRTSFCRIVKKDSFVSATCSAAASVSLDSSRIGLPVWSTTILEKEIERRENREKWARKNERFTCPCQLDGSRIFLVFSLVPFSFAFLFEKKESKQRSQQTGNATNSCAPRDTTTNTPLLRVLYSVAQKSPGPAATDIFFYLFIYFHTEVRKAIRSMNLLSTFVCVRVYAYVCGSYNYYPFCFSLCFLLFFHIGWWSCCSYCVVTRIC